MHLSSQADPIFVSVQQAAEMLAISKWSMYELLNSEAVESRYQGRKRLVDVASLRQYAADLPRYRPEPTPDIA